MEGGNGLILKKTSREGDAKKPGDWGGGIVAESGMLVMLKKESGDTSPQKRKGREMGSKTAKREHKGPAIHCYHNYNSGAVIAEEKRKRVFKKCDRSSGDPRKGHEEKNFF